MEWRDEGVILSARRHGEDALILEALTAAHGRHAGIVRGGASRKMAPLLQPGADVSLEWRARLGEHLGAFRAEPLRSRAGALMADGDALAAMASVAALLTAFLPEREPCPALHAATVSLLDSLGAAPDWPEAYVAWELMLLSELGWPLELSACAVTGAREDLTHVSPKSGRAVSRAAAEPWGGRLLPLPGFLGGAAGDANGGGLAEGLALSGFFLERWVGAGDLPAPRGRLAERLARRA
ncbi:MAG: DNA repair protein RecO [Pikeienuella sp.]|uniref:DNA repair protein RecO n=1 Tax=Pikeienuella sp. TaxID=2831957 RepID=UPI0039189E90